MTKEEILKMEAGPKMNGVIAKEIFGKWVEWKPLHYPFEIIPIEIGPGHHRPEIPIKNYSTSISVAFEVVEKFAGINLSKRLQGNWYCEFLLDKEYGADGKTAPLAICRAALLTRMEDK